MWPENLSLAGRGLCLRAAGKHVPAGRIRCQSADKDACDQKIRLRLSGHHIKQIRGACHYVRIRYVCCVGIFVLVSPPQLLKFRIPREFQQNISPMFRKVCRTAF